MKLDFHTKKLIEKNMPYIGIFGVFVLLLLYLLRFQLPNYLSYRSKITSLKTEVADLDTKKTVIYSFNPSQLNGLVSILNNLLPTKEDYFSIVSTLEQIAEKTDFHITSYTVNFSKDSKDKIVLKINGEGTNSSIMKFLQDYQVTGGRLITMDAIQFSPSTTKAVLNLNFYSKDVQVLNESNIAGINADVIKLLEKTNKTMSDIIKTPQDDTEVPYAPKADPFN